LGKGAAYIYGKNSLLERLKANPESIRKIFLQENFKDPSVLDAIRKSGVAVKHVSERELGRIKRAERLQGIAAEVDRFEYAPFEELLDVSAGSSKSLIFLDNINDPHNLGSMLRVAACFGGFAIVLPRHSSCDVNDTVMHVASGGENFVSVAVVGNISNALRKAKDCGYWIVGTVVEGGQDLDSVTLPFPLCLVLGSEGKGIRHGIDKQLDCKVTLPMRGAELSFNVAMACAIFCHEISRQRKG